MTRRALVLASIVLATASAGRAQSPAAAPTPLPIVIAADVPVYPQLAKSARIEGTVRFRVTTDGTQVVAVEDIGPNPLLYRSAVDNLRTWRFAPHRSATFVLAFRYSLRSIPRRVANSCLSVSVDEPAVVTFSLPTFVEVVGTADYFCEPYYEPDSTRYRVSTFEGTVLCDCPGHNPIAGASIQLQGDSHLPRSLAYLSTTTDANGHFRISSVVGGSYGVWIDHVEYFPRAYGRVVVDPGRSSADTLSLSMKPNLAVQKYLREKPRTLWVGTKTIPTYPIEALTSGIEGLVTIRVSDRGKSIEAIDGDVILKKAALEYARSWQASSDDGQPFDVRINYRLVAGDCIGGGPTVTLRLPQGVEITAKRPIRCDGGGE